MTSTPSLGAGSSGRRTRPPGPSGSSEPSAAPGPSPAPGPFGRLGAWSATHARTVFVLWAVVVAVLGAFAPKVESALSGAGWQADGSQSVAVRQIAQQHFGGDASSAIQVVVHAGGPVSDPAVQSVISRAEGILGADPRVASVVPPQAGATISPDGRTA